MASTNLSDPITLAAPIRRGDGAPIQILSLRRPDVGALRGLKLADLLQMDVRAMTVLLPRITTPSLLPDEVEALDPRDLLNLSARVVGFFAPEDQMAGMMQ